MNTEYLSGLLRFKPECIQKLSIYLKMDKTDSEIISVGSGTGYFEYHLQKMLGSKHGKIVCVDPAHDSYAKTHPNENMMPDFAILDDVAKSGKNISDSIILLNWPSPDPVDILMNGYENESSYDYDAVVKYKPKMFFVSYDKKGISGSIRFISLLNNHTIQQSASTVEHIYPGQPTAVCAALSHKLVNTDVANIINVAGTNYYLIYSQYINGMVCKQNKNDDVPFEMPQRYTTVLYIREDHISNYNIQKEKFPIVTTNNMIIDYQNKTFNFV